MYKVGIIGAGICGLKRNDAHRNQIEFKIFESSNKSGCIKPL